MVALREVGVRGNATPDGWTEGAGNGSVNAAVEARVPVLYLSAYRTDHGNRRRSGVQTFDV